MSKGGKHGIQVGRKVRVRLGSTEVWKERRMGLESRGRRFDGQSEPVKIFGVGRRIVGIRGLMEIR